MSPTYTITVKNHTGMTQNYALFSEPSEISGGPGSEVWASVIESGRSLPPGAMLRFELNQDYYAFSGNYRGTPEYGCRLNINQAQPVELGRDGAPGSTVKLNARDGGSDVYLDPAKTPGDATRGAIVIDTGDAGFTLQDAKNSNLAVGIATGARDGGECRVLCSFTPSPNVKYNVKPSGIYHVASGERLDPGQLIKAQMMQQQISVDFQARGVSSITIVHDPSGRFKFV